VLKQRFTPTRKTESEECIGETRRKIKGGLGNTRVKDGIHDLPTDNV